VEEEAELVDNSQQKAPDSHRSAQDQRNARIRELENEVERYRRAAEDALSQLDWCIGYMHGCGKKSLARSLSRNRGYIRTHLMKRSEQPVPTQGADESNPA
jgi:hypothetical protein